MTPKMERAFLRASEGSASTSRRVGSEEARRRRLAWLSRLWEPGRPMLELSRRPRRGASAEVVERVEVLRAWRRALMVL
jgi:hypothetical protein